MKISIARIAALALLTSYLAVTPNAAHAQQRRKAQTQSATITVNATLSYQVGGTQPVAAGDIQVLDENPEQLMTCPVPVFVTAAILNESLSIARLRINAAQARQEGNAAYADQVESLLRIELENERLRQELAFNRNEVRTPRDESVEQIREAISKHVVARATTNNYGTVSLRGLPAGKKIYVLASARTRGGVVVWLFEATLDAKPETLILNNSNALVLF